MQYLNNKRLLAQVETARNIAFTKDGEVKYLREKQLQDRQRMHVCIKISQCAAMNYKLIVNFMLSFLSEFAK